MCNLQLAIGTYQFHKILPCLDISIKLGIATFEKCCQLITNINEKNKGDILKIYITYH